MAQNDETEAKIKYKKVEENKIEGTVTSEPEKVSARELPQTELPRRTIDSLDAKGYNPGIQRGAGEGQPTKSELPRRPSLEGKNQVAPGGGASPQRPIDSREEAPDIGKDYGDSREPGYNGYREDGGQPHRGSDIAGGVPEQDHSIQPGEQPWGVPNGTNGLDRKNDLNEEKKKEQTKKTEEQEKKERENTTSKGSEKDGAKKSGESKKEGDINPEAPDSRKKPAQPASEGNGYGALNRPNEGRTAEKEDSTARARRNFEHTRRMQQGDQESQGSPAGGKDSKLPAKTGLRRQSNNGEGNNSSKGSLGARLKNSLAKLGKNRSKDSISEGGEGGKSSSTSFTDNLRRFANFVIKHPYVAITIGVVILIFLILIISCFEDGSFGGGRGVHCTYNLKGVSTSGEVKLEGLQVELINCDGRASNYTVLETVDFEKYVLGVALAEIGPGAPDEAFKAQIIAARGFALSRNSGMCPGNQDGCFYGYNASTGKIRMRACEADQVYWDYDKNIYRQERGAISLYSPEVTSGALWKAALSEESKSHYLALADEVKGQVLVDSNGNVVKTSYINTTSQQFISKANEGKDYEQILSEVYTESDGFSSGHCTSYGNIDYGDYVLSSDGHVILHEPIDQFLRKNGTNLAEFNALIESNVDKAGYGTRAGVVAAAVTLIAELGNNYGVKVPYFWGGGHYDGVVIGALDTWGSTQCHTYANNTSYNYCGLDCSGFVPWAIKNGGFNMVQNLAGNFKNLPGVKKVSLSNKPVLEPGDLLESTEHIVLVVGIEESSGNYICAEASGNSAGVLFTRRPFNSSSYWGVKMDGYYENNARSK